MAVKTITLKKPVNKIRETIKKKKVEIKSSVKIIFRLECQSTNGPAKNPTKTHGMIFNTV